MPRPRRVARLALAAAVTLAACDGDEPDRSAPPLLTPVTFADLPGWAADSLSDAVAPLLRSCARLAPQPDDRPVGRDGMAGTVADWRQVCEAAERLPPGDGPSAGRFFETAFVPYRLAGSDGDQGLFTGYYEPELDGARRPDERYKTPLHRPPPDLVTVDLGEFRADLKGESIAGRVVDGRLRPYFTYEEIAGGALAGRGLELVWIDDPVDAFFLHIQGSGRVRLSDGATMRVGYAAKNGQPYFAIGRALIEQREIAREDMSMQRIRDWLRAHPVAAPALMYRNRSYVFFREIDGDGPVGAQGVVLTAGRSLAVDPAFVPLGAPLWIDTTFPAGHDGAGRPLRRLVVAQDTGGAIKGAVRGDLFWGTGEAALVHAGAMKQGGRLYLLLPRVVAERRDRTS